MVFSFRSLNYKLHIQALKLYKYIHWHMRQMCLHRHILLFLTAASVDINMLLLASAFVGTFYLAFHPYSDPAISGPLHPSASDAGLGGGAHGNGGLWTHRISG